MRLDVFLVWLLIFIGWGIFRVFFRLPSAIDEVSLKPIIFILPVFLVTFLHEKKTFASLGLAPKLRTIFLDVYIGVAIGILFAMEGLFANFFKYGIFSFEPIAAVALAGGIVPFLSINLVTAISEEILGRGYLFARLSDRFGEFVGAIVSSVLFLLLHIPIMFAQLQLTGSALVIYPLSIFLLSLTNCYIFAARKSLVLPILIHLFWSMTVALYL